MAHRLTACIRAQDTLARQGGDEFVVMLQGLSPSMPEAVQQARTQAAAAPPLSAESPDRRRPYAMGGGFVGDVQREECDQLSWGKTP